MESRNDHSMEPPDKNWTQIDLEHGYPNFWLAWASLRKEKLFGAAFKIYNLVNVYK